MCKLGMGRQLYMYIYKLAVFFFDGIYELAVKHAWRTSNTYIGTNTKEHIIMCVYIYLFIYICTCTHI